MGKFETKTKRWGNSMGVIIPKHIADELGIKNGDTVEVELNRRLKVKDILGLLPPRKDKKPGDTQRFKDELRREWSKW